MQGTESPIGKIIEWPAEGRGIVFGITDLPPYRMLGRVFADRGRYLLVSDYDGQARRVYKTKPYRILGPSHDGWGNTYGPAGVDVEWKA